MTIAEAREKCKGALAKVPRDALILSILVCASSASFALGYLAGRDVGATGDEVLLQAPLAVATSTAGAVVASKSGTKYYFPSCAGASRISDANKVWFASVSVANTAGYSLAANCTAP